MKLKIIVLGIISSMISLSAYKGPFSAAYYERNSYHQFNAALESVQDLYIAPHSKVLELGCGLGDLAALLIQKNPTINIVATDISSDMIEYAQEKYAMLDNLTFRVANAEQLPADFKDRFDYIICTNSFHWFKDQKAVYRAIQKSLKPGGIFLINACMQAEDYPIFTAVNNAALQPQWQGCCSNFVSLMQEECPGLNLEIFEELLAQKKFSAIIIKKDFPRLFIFNHKASFIEWLNPLLRGYTMLASFTENQKSAFINSVATEFIEHFNAQNKQGTIEYILPHNIWIIAQKL